MRTFESELRSLSMFWRGTPGSHGQPCCHDHCQVATPSAIQAWHIQIKKSPSRRTTRRPPWGLCGHISLLHLTVGSEPLMRPTQHRLRLDHCQRNLFLCSRRISGRSKTKRHVEEPRPPSRDEFKCIPSRRSLSVSWPQAPRQNHGISK